MSGERALIFHLTVILACQLGGELLVAAAGLPVPGPVAGMALLFAGLMWRGLPEGLAKVGDALVQNLSLLFVPAGVGVMVHAGLLGREWLPISVALVVSTLLTIGLTGRLMAWLGRRVGEEAGDE